MFQGTVPSSRGLSPVNAFLLRKPLDPTQGPSRAQLSCCWVPEGQHKVVSGLYNLSLVHSASQPRTLKVRTQHCCHPHTCFNSCVLFHGLRTVFFLPLLGLYWWTPPISSSVRQRRAEQPSMYSLLCDHAHTKLSIDVCLHSRSSLTP